MLRHRRLLQVMHRLALMGALLMAIAPVISRWMQPEVGLDPQPQRTAVCTSHGMQQLDPGAAMALMHAAHLMSMDMPMPGMKHGDAGTMPIDQQDGMVCDYCVLSANLLPFVLVLLVLPLLQQAAARLPVLRMLPRATSTWPAHGARGPPSFLPA
ncbi:DUF2946 family protein [Xanthomonas arboricola]